MIDGILWLILGCACLAAVLELADWAGEADDGPPAWLDRERADDD